MIFVPAKTSRDAGGYVQFFTSQVLIKISYIDFCNRKNPKGGRRLCAIFNSPSTCKNFIYWFLRVKNPHGWPEALSKIWNRHVAKAFSVSNWPQITGWIWNYLNQLNLKTMSDWTVKLDYGGYLQRPKRLQVICVNITLKSTFSTDLTFIWHIFPYSWKSVGQNGDRNWPSMPSS